MDERLYKCKGDCGQKHYKEYLDENGYCESCQQKFCDYECKGDCNKTYKYKQLNKDGYCSKCAIKNFNEFNFTNAYSKIAILILILGFIGGIVMGNVFKVYTLTYESPISAEYNDYEYIFNTALMIYCWIGTFLFDLFVLGIYSICKRLDLIANRLKDIG